jgi:hypothetical protein
MEHWFALLVVLSQVAVLQFYAVPYGTRLMYRRALNRNPEWVAEHPEFTAENPAPRASVWISYAMGLAIYARVFFAPDAAPIFIPHDTTSESLLVDSIIASGLLMLVHHSVYLLRVRRMIRRVPPPEIRKASLDRRALRDFLPIGWVYAAGALIAAVCAVYTYALFAEIIPRETFFARVHGLFICCAIWAGIVLYTLRRKPTEADEILSGRFRLWEVRSIVALLYFIAAVGVWRILGDIFDVWLFSDLGFFVVMSIAIQVGSVWACRHEVSPTD